MKKDNYAKQPWFTAIKGAQRDLIKAVGGIDRAALLLDKSLPHVGRYNNWQTPDLMATWEVIVLEAEAGRPIVTRSMVSQTGATVVESSGPSRGRDCLHTGSAKMMTEYAEFMAIYSEAASDGDFTPAEMLEMLPAVDDVRRSADAMHAKIHRRLALALNKAGAE